ncbi:hypothetical protein AB6A40_011440 [Gnathostoma spinigerum]|uniref:Kinesin motor domain-containing protein n=1 Tax=Gnathostoma spinigerum TaxID=75299 RepID=A0ABD6F2Z4_9BILA
MTDHIIPVKVAVRVRPLDEYERLKGAKEYLQYNMEEKQLSLNGKAFGFDAVFDPTSTQNYVFETCAAPLLEHLLKGTT